MKKNPMTLRGLKKLRKELNNLKKIKRPKIIASIAEAREHGDLKENAEYHAAREEQGFCEGRIKEIESKLSCAQVIDIKKIPNKGRIIFGSTVTVMNVQTSKQSIYCIVGDDEADFRKKLISIHSPMARGLIGKKINDFTVIETPKGNVEYQIIQVEYL
ncbi:transcription elongation factor GreA [Candidatus Tachikawaea gelatinosa]|uniref:Transcription elongation factor GreA n=1 Tax=Candidatus Tachikawaea gelatinosa TaxID=1410383 RepID=A0A090BWM2_9ENTR|nr:transcription elongation factor GreA [Candidatus Tachikawaea gelatinosa]BAP58851.1 transcription elongation factor GreA [Candidatus Tachikawaea gelatinosa]